MYYYCCLPALVLWGKTTNSKKDNQYGTDYCFCIVKTVKGQKDNYGLLLLKAMSVAKREKERERECVCVYVHAYMHVCVCVCVCVCVREREREREREGECSRGHLCERVTRKFLRKSFFFPRKASLELVLKDHGPSWVYIIPETSRVESTGKVSNSPFAFACGGLRAR